MSINETKEFWHLHIFSRCLRWNFFFECDYLTDGMFCCTKLGSYCVVTSTKSFSAIRVYRLTREGSHSNRQALLTVHTKKESNNSIHAYCNWNHWWSFRKKKSFFLTNFIITYFSFLKFITLHFLGFAMFEIYLKCRIWSLQLLAFSTNFLLY